MLLCGGVLGSHLQAIEAHEGDARRRTAANYGDLHALRIDWQYNSHEGSQVHSFTGERSMKTVATARELDFFALGKELRESADDAHEGETPSLDLAYSFLTDNPECFGYEEWPSDMPETAPEELQRSYGFVAPVRS